MRMKDLISGFPPPPLKNPKRLVGGISPYLDKPNLLLFNDKVESKKKFFMQSKSKIKSIIASLLISGIIMSQNSVNAMSRTSRKYGSRRKKAVPVGSIINQEKSVINQEREKKEKEALTKFYDLCQYSHREEMLTLQDQQEIWKCAKQIIQYVPDERLSSFGSLLVDYLCSVIEIPDWDLPSYKIKTDFCGGIVHELHDIVNKKYFFDQENFSLLFPSNISKDQFIPAGKKLIENYPDAELVKEIKIKITDVLDKRNEFSTSDKKFILEKIFEN